MTQATITTQAPAAQARGELYDVNRQWASRPSDERYTSLAALRTALASRQEITIEANRPVGALQVVPRTADMLTANDGGVVYLRSKDGDTGEYGGRALFTHSSFGQLAGIAGAPANFMRQLSAPVAALALNESLIRRAPYAFSESGVTKLLLTQAVKRGDGTCTPAMVRALTSESYGRVTDLSVADAVIGAVQDLDRSGTWGIPGTFGGNSGRAYTPYNGTGADTTLYASDHDVFIFLADEARLLAAPGADAGYGVEGQRPMSRGFIVWNSETGAKTLGAKFFTFDYVCKNRIIWDASILASVRIRHTSGAPRRFMSELTPAIRAFVEGSDAPILARISAAQAQPVGDGTPETLTAFLGAMGLSQTVAKSATELAAIEEGRTDTVWAAIQGLTAYARGVDYADDRVELETIAGAMLADRVLDRAGSFERSTRSQRMAGAGALA